jgi:hypothetical protein
MPRRPGPPPKEPAARLRRNRDTVTGAAKPSAKPTKKPPAKRTRRAAAASQTPIIGIDGWVSIPPGPRTAPAPKLPGWLPVGESAKAYAELAKLPQAKAWLTSEWTLLQLALPLLDTYLGKPGSESFKAIVTALGPALKLTSDDLAKARMRIADIMPAEAPPAGDDDDDKPPAVVTAITSRRKRLTSAG